MNWVFLTRAGSEQDLVDELTSSNEPRRLADGVVSSMTRPKGPDGHLTDPAFARQAMRKATTCPPEPPAVARQICKAMRSHLPRNRDTEIWSWTLQVVSPDTSDPKDPRRKVTALLEETLPDLIEAALPDAVNARRTDSKSADRLIQVWIVETARVWIGVTSATQTLSRIAGGRTKLKRPADAVSRSGLKLEEAIEWVGVGPERGDLCADLGSAPGGWTQVAAQRGASVIAVDPAKMKVDLPKKRFEHLQKSAFDYAPPETLDWVICDMAWRPLEVAQLLGKWARRIWARQMIVNFKLPMVQKAKMLKQILDVLEKAGWQNLRARQLFHDRDEVTIFGYLDPSRAHLAAQPAFQMRSGPKSPGGASKKRPPKGKGPRSKDGKGPRGRDGKGPRGRDAKPARGRAKGRKPGPRRRR